MRRCKDGRIIDGRHGETGPIGLWNLGPVVVLDDPAYDCHLTGCTSAGVNTVRMMGPPPGLEPRFVQLCATHTDPRHEIVDTVAA